MTIDEKKCFPRRLGRQSRAWRAAASGSLILRRKSCLIVSNKLVITAMGTTLAFLFQCESILATLFSNKYTTICQISEAQRGHFYDCIFTSAAIPSPTSFRITSKWLRVPWKVFSGYQCKPWLPFLSILPTWPCSSLTHSLSAAWKRLFVIAGSSLVELGMSCTNLLNYKNWCPCITCTIHRADFVVLGICFCTLVQFEPHCVFVHVWKCVFPTTSALERHIHSLRQANGGRHTICCLFVHCYTSNEWFCKGCNTLCLSTSQPSWMYLTHYDAITQDL